MTAACQRGQSEEIPKAGGHGRGHVVRVESEAFGAKDKSHHNDTWIKIKHAGEIKIKSFVVALKTAIMIHEHMMF